MAAAWLGKGRSTVPRLAAAISLLAWSYESGPDGPSGHILGEHVDAAARLWSEYFRSHAKAVLHADESPVQDQRIHRMLRWLQRERSTLVSLTDIRRSGLARTASLFEAEQVIHRLEEANVLFFADSKRWHGPGRPKRCWMVNPALAGLGPGA